MFSLSIFFFRLSRYRNVADESFAICLVFGNQTVALSIVAGSVVLSSNSLNLNWVDRSINWFELERFSSICFKIAACLLSDSVQDQKRRPIITKTETTLRLVVSEVGMSVFFPQ